MVENSQTRLCGDLSPVHPPLLPSSASIPGSWLHAPALPPAPRHADGTPVLPTPLPPQGCGWPHTPFPWGQKVGGGLGACPSLPVVAPGRRLDYSGIALLIMGSFVPWLYYSFYCSPQPRLIYLSIVCVLGISAIIVAQWDRFATPKHRQTRAGRSHPTKSLVSGGLWGGALGRSRYGVAPPVWTKLSAPAKFIPSKQQVPAGSFLFPLGVSGI